MKAMKVIGCSPGAKRKSHNFNLLHCIHLVGNMGVSKNRGTPK